MSLALPYPVYGLSVEMRLGSGAMLRRLFDEIYGRSLAAFPAPGSLEEAAHLLGRSTPRSSFSHLFSNAVIGAVSVNRIVLRRHRPFFRNPFAPIFRGRFIVESGRTVLEGTFELHPFVKAFMTLWFGGIGIFCIVNLFLGPIIAADKGAPWWAGLLSGLGFALAGFLLGLVGFGFVWFSKWLSQGDTVECRRHIASSLPQ